MSFFPLFQRGRACRLGGRWGDLAPGRKRLRRLGSGNQWKRVHQGEGASSGSRKDFDEQGHKVSEKILDLFLQILFGKEEMSILGTDRCLWDKSFENKSSKWIHQMIDGKIIARTAEIRFLENERQADDHPAGKNRHPEFEKPRHKFRLQE